MVWCVEDDKSIRDIEIYTLKSTGFDAIGFSDGMKFFEALKTDKPDLIILDIMLPDMDGTDILKRLKGSPDTNSIPVIMATAKGMEYDKVQSLDMGADDYLVKPFGMMEMVSRIKAVLRRCHLEKDVVIKYGTLQMDLQQRIVTIGNERIILTYKEFEILRLFLTNVGKVFTRDKLFNAIWENDYLGESRTIDVHIRTLRHKIGIYGKSIETVRNVGYRMEVFKG